MITNDSSVKLDFVSSDDKFIAAGDKQNVVSFNILQILQMNFLNTKKLNV
jgi:hypothetical protein